MIVSVLVGVADPDAEARRWAEAFSWRVTRQVPASASSPRRLELASPARSSGRLILVQSRPGADLPCPGHLGWAALELAVQDVDSAAARAVAAGFSLLGEPAALSSTSSLRSAQLAGPGGLMVYLTQQVGDTGPFGLIPPLAPVDAIYGVVLATRRLERARARYEAVLAAERLSDHPVAVGVLNKVFGLDPATAHRISTLGLGSGCILEIDQYPPQAAVAPDPGEPGWASVLFRPRRPWPYGPLSLSGVDGESSVVESGSAQPSP
jgi:catechol 2,3-dioxygenase-like lactoylglutathione lyase family enzyme